jgi:biopolymer transport protein TolR
MGTEVGQKGNLTASMNVVPLIDILLVLIIIFMVITPLTPQGLEAQIPQPTKADRPAPRETMVVVQILDSGSLKINEEDATWDSLGGRLSDVFKERAEKVAFVQGGDSVRFSEIANVIDIMRSSGIDKVGLITAKLPVL